MQLARLLIPDDLVVGISIAETAITAVLFSYERHGKELVAKTTLAVREEIPVGTIEQGAVRNQEVLVGALRQLVKKVPAHARYAVLTVPGDRVYFKTFTFPETLAPAKIEAAMRSAALFQLPWKQVEAYVDWERIAGTGEQPVMLLGALPKEMADPYIKACALAKIKVIALEVHAMSIARSVVCDEGASCLISLDDSMSTALTVMVNGVVRFHRVVPHAYADAAMLKDEARKISEYIIADPPIGGAAITVPLDMQTITIKEPYGQFADIAADPAEWARAVGAAMRGLLPRKSDTIISFIPVGTEEAYREQKTLAFTGFLSAVTIGVSIFFVVVFLSAWWGAAYLRTATLQEISVLNQVPISTDAVALEDRVTNFNQLASVSGSFIKQFPQWTKVLDEVLGRMTPGITVQNLSLAAANGVFTLGGIGVDRVSVNLLRKSFEASALFTGIQLPLSNLEQKTNIPFTITFKLKDPAGLVVY